MKQKLICHIDKNLEIWADIHQYILRKDNNPNKNSYYSSLESIIQDVLQLKIKQFASESVKKDLKGLGQSIKKAEFYVHETLRPMLNGYKNQTGNDPPKA